MSSYRFPAEWHRQRAIWLSVPHNIETWPDLNKIWPSYTKLIKEIAEDQKVCLQVNDLDHENQFKALLETYKIPLENLKFYHHPTNDSWCRDHGPLFVINDQGQVKITNWTYNCWGEKYPPFDADNKIPKLIAKATHLEIDHIDMILEGGSVEFNGCGDMITTKSVLLNKNRNPNLSQAEIESHLKDNLGVENIIWLEQGIEGDDTDGHIDDITRFVNEDTVITVIEDNINDSNHKILASNLKALKMATLRNGKKLKVIYLPMPNAIHKEGIRLPGSYANFLITNKKVIVPIFNCSRDEEALSILQNQFKDREVVGIDSTEIIWGLGSFHCLSQQEPMESN